jgi:flagellin
MRAWMSATNRKVCIDQSWRIESMAITRINNNISALNATRNLNSTGRDLQKSLERLSSGLRINRAADDAAGLSISERQRTQIRGLNQAISNAQDAISLINTAEGALNETTSRLQRIRELAVQAANSGGLDQDAISATQEEIKTAISEITRIGDTTQYSTRKLLNGNNSNQANIATGSPDRGASVVLGPLNSTLQNGLHFLNITKTAVGTETITSGLDGVLNAGALTGNLTGSSFDSGAYTISVSNARSASAKTQNILSLTHDSSVTAVTAGERLDFLNVGGVGVDGGDTFTITGTESDGTTTTSTTVTATSSGTTSFQTLINAILSAYTTATATTTGAAAGQAASIDLTDLATGSSSSSITISFFDASAATTTNMTSAITNPGNYNDAVININGGPAKNVVANTVVTLFGPSPDDPAATTGQITLTLGALTNGSDTLSIVEQQFQATLDGGRAITFQNGDQDVEFISGNSAGFSSGDALILNFAPIIDVATTATVLISAVNNALNFQIGANQGQRVLTAIGDLRGSNLGFIEGIVNDDGTTTRLGTVDAINVLTVSGAEDAMSIVDRAITQVSRQRALLGALTNRLEATIANLGVASENLAAAESRIRDADIAYETTRFSRNQILLQAGTAILAQANLAPQAVLQLLG